MKKTYALAFASSLLLLGSCTNDAPEYPQFEPIDEEGNIGYIRFNLANSETRADADLDEGTADEKAIDHIDFLFTDTDNKPFKVKVGKEDIENGKAIVKLPRMPKYVAVVVNGQSEQLTNLTDITKAEYAVSQYTFDGTTNKNFYMSSSMYYGTGNNPSKIYRTNISASQVYKSIDAAKAGSSVSVTVERYVAKVNVKSDITLGTDGTLNPLTGDHASDVKNNNVAATVSFKPEYVFLTGTNDKGFRVKNLPDYSALESEYLKTWCNDYNGKRSFWVGNTAGTVKFPTLNQLNGNDADGETPMWAKAWGANDVFYPFENKQSDYAKKTSVVVCGKYEVKDAAGNNLADTDGSFYLVAFENNFTFCKTEGDAIKAMGGKETDVLVPEGPNSADLTAGYSDASWTGWTGWLKIKGSDIVVRCLKYSGGYGYYSKEIVRTTDAANDEVYEAIVRNHSYSINLKGIAGMGVGIPDPDQPIINIPNPDPSAQNYFLNMSVRVLDWRTVDTQNVEWK